MRCAITSRIWMPIRSACANRSSAWQSVMDASRKYRVAPEQLDEALQGIVARLEELGGDADIDELDKQEKAAHATLSGGGAEN